MRSKPGRDDRAGSRNSRAREDGDRTLDVFEVFAQAKGPLTLTELAARLGSPLSSCHALVRTLQARGYLHILDERKRVYPTKRLLTIMQQIAHYDPVLEMIGPVLAALQQACGETVILGKRQGMGITYLDVLESRQTIRYAASPGDTKPLHSSAIGKAMLGALPEQEMVRLVKRLPLPAVTQHTIGTAAGLVDDIRAGQVRGWFLTRGENVPEVMAIARNLRDECCGVAIAGPIWQLDENPGSALAAAARPAVRGSSPSGCPG